MRATVATVLSESRRRPGRALITLALFLAVGASPLVFSPDLYDNFTLPKQAVLAAAAGMALLGCAFEGRLLPRNRFLRLAFILWLASLFVSWIFGLDPLGSVLGYYQYRQGLLTQLSCALLFAASLQAARWLSFRAIAWPGLGALVVVAAYTGVQKSGHDPFSWWIDASARTIGTIGNANELAAYAVMSLAFCGVLAASSRRWRLAVEVVGGGAAGLIVLCSQSRSGLLALAIVLCTFAMAGILVRWPARRVALHTAALVVGIVGGFLVGGALEGGSSSAAGRVEAGIAQSDPAGSTRVQLWRGTLATFEASPLIGFGPDALYKAFPVHRPADLHGAFDSYDLVAQSSHNWFLDTAANTGLLGLAGLGAVLATALVLSVGWRRGREQPEPAGDARPYIWGAMAGYLALTLVNPLSLAPQAIFFVLLGWSAGRFDTAPSAAPARQFSPAVRVGFAAPAAFALGVVAVLLPLADLSAQAAWTKYAHGEFVNAAKDAARASDIMPLEQIYARREANAWLADGAAGGTGSLLNARSSFEKIDLLFGLTSLDATALATARIGLHRPAAEVNATVDRVVALNPHGVFISWYSALLRRAATAGGTLRYLPADDWVRVEANGDVAVPGISFPAGP